MSREPAPLPPGTDLDTEEAIGAVFVVLADRIDPGEVTKLVTALPRQIRALWPAA